MDITSPRKLAAPLGETARAIAETDGDFIAQTAAYALLLRAWTGAFDDLARAVTDRSLVDRIGSLLAATDLCAVFSGYIAEGKDPSIYFYEDFLRAYDSKTSRSRGVHYSPPAVVSYMLGGVETILLEQFGEAASRAAILDPCCGIGTFLHQLPESLPRRRVIGLEISAPACALASRLTNGCEIRHADSLQDIDLGIDGGPLVVIGNPPYSGHSANAGAIADLMEDYRIGLNERNPKWLQDDYVKFIRMAQHRVDRAGSGIIAFITNHNYLVNPTFRAMRLSLMDSFDQVHALNLYGNALTHEQSDEPDESIFAIRMGVAITFMVKLPNPGRHVVLHAGIRGARQHKLSRLSSMTFHDTPWREVDPIKPFSAFVQTDRALRDEFYGFASLFDLFREHSVGFVTSRDAFAIDTDRDALLARIADLRDPKISPRAIRETHPVTDLDIEEARRELLADLYWEDKAIEVLYRPFDKRWAYYSRAVMERARLPFMESMMQDNVALAIGRAGQVTGSSEWDVVFCSDRPADLNLFRRGGAMLFPLYHYEHGRRMPNMVQDNDLIFYYVYAMLHSGIYRKRYSDFLAIDYPRIPLSADMSRISRLADLGEKLVEIHLMRRELPHDAPADPGPALRIGGWDIPGKYLADRKRRELTGSEHIHLARIAWCAARTIAIREEIDSIIECTP